NDTICLMCTPIVLALVAEARLPPLPYLLALAFASNAGSVATLTGNPQNMLIGTLSGIGYADFAKALILPAVLSLGCVYLVLRLAFRRELAPSSRVDAHVPEPPLRRGHALLCAGALVFVVACQLVSNVPFVLLASHWLPKMADPHISWLSLALVSTLAGNLTPVASVANLIVFELAGNKGKIPFLRFLLVGAGATFLPLVV